jgi:acetolactate synthase-1/2/3 large subunit
MTLLSGGEALVKSLLSNGVGTIFGLPGGQTYEFFDAVQKEGGNLALVNSRHEQGAAYMAYGYARSTGKVGVYCVVPGPGVLNTTAALATAYGTGTPVLCVAGQIPSTGIGRGFGYLHEIPDQLGILRSLTKWAARISHPAFAPQLVNEAFAHLQSGRPRPVALEMAPDTMELKGDVELLGPGQLPPPLAPDPDLIDRAAAILCTARRPMIVIGGGAIDARTELVELAQLLQAPIVANWNAKGIVDDRLPFSLSYPAGHRLWATADAVLAVGTRLKHPLMYWGRDDGLPIIRIDVDPAEIDRIASPAVGIHADARAALQLLIPAVGRRSAHRPSRIAELRALKSALHAELQNKLGSLVAILEAIRQELPEDGFLVDEITQVGFASWFAFPVYSPRHFVSSGYQGNLGYGYATALGVQVAHPDKKVVALAGDGGFMYAVQELATAVRYQLAVVVVVFNNNSYGNVKRDQTDRFAGRVIGSDLTNPDFVKLAESFGAAGYRCTTPAQLAAALRTALQLRGPALIEMPVGELPNPWQYIALRRCR